MISNLIEPAMGITHQREQGWMGYGYLPILFRTPEKSVWSTINGGWPLTTPFMFLPLHYKNQGNLRIQPPELLTKQQLG